MTQDTSSEHKITLDDNVGNNESASCALLDSGSALMARAVPSQTWAVPSWRWYVQYVFAAWASKRNNLSTLIYGIYLIDLTVT
jgi:hypothetical protein